MLIYKYYYKFYIIYLNIILLKWKGKKKNM